MDRRAQRMPAPFAAGARHTPPPEGDKRKEDMLTQREYRVARDAIERRSEDEDIRTGAVDLMADILHVLDQFGEDPMAAMQMAWRHYLDEITDARRGC